MWRGGFVRVRWDGQGAGDFNPAEHAWLLAEQMREARHLGRLPGPCVPAHIGYVFSLAGDPVSAAAHIEAEKAAFPESARLMDRLLGRMSQ